MKALGILFIVAGAIVGYFTVIDRETALALDFVEAVPVTSAWAILVGMGVVLVIIDLGRGVLAKGEEVAERPRRRPPPQQKADRLELPMNRGRILNIAKNFDFGGQVRIEPDAAPGVPLTLVLEHMSPQGVKRTCERLGAMVMEIPRPPRIRIQFVQCPDGPTPRQHVVAGALGQSLSRSEFKATAHLDFVEVLFFRADPDWLDLWGPGRV